MDKISKEISDEVAEMASFQAEHIEKFAAAFIKETGLDPTKVKMGQHLMKDGLGAYFWFEPFPKESEIEMYRAGQERALADLAARDALIERMISLIDNVIDDMPAYNADEWQVLVAEYRASN